MALPFLNKKSAKAPDQVFAIDLGGRTTKAAYLHRKGDVFSLSRFTMTDAPVFEKSWSIDLLSAHLKEIAQTIDPKTKQVTIALGPNDLLVRNLEMPPMPIYEMRQVLKINSKTYLQQELTGYVYDCTVLPVKDAVEKGKGASQAKPRVLVAAAKKTLLDDLQTAIRNAGLIPDLVVPSLIGPVNAFERAMPDVYSKEVIALVDVGFRNSTICLLKEGELMMSREVNIGGDKITQGLADMMGISYAEAEGIKIGMPTEVQTQLEMVVSPLGRELRASIDFFEHQQDRTISQVFISGGSARSELIVKTLQTELGVECRPWNPIGSLQTNLSPQQSAELEQISPQLTAAIGIALTSI